MLIFAHEITKNKIDDEEGLSKQNQGGVGR